MPDTQNHIEEIIQVASGNLLKKDYAGIIGIDPTRLSRELPSHYERAIKQLQARNVELQASVKRLQSNTSELQAQNNRLQTAAITAQENETSIFETYKSLQVEKEQLQARFIQMQAEKEQLQAEFETMQADWLKWKGQPEIIKWLAKQDTLVYMLFLLAFFEIGGSFHLLQHKGLFIAIPVSIALGFALLIFTARGNMFGKLFCISFALLVGALFFDILPHVTADWLFAFTPPAIAAMIAFSFKKR